jgi:hypothetical protein
VAVGHHSDSRLFGGSQCRLGRGFYFLRLALPLRRWKSGQWDGWANVMAFLLSPANNGGESMNNMCWEESGRKFSYKNRPSSIRTAQFVQGHHVSAVAVVVQMSTAAAVIVVSAALIAGGRAGGGVDESSFISLFMTAAAPATRLGFVFDTVFVP